MIGVKAVITNNINQVLVLREAKYDEGTNEGKWDVPGGRINPEEPILFALQREVREESGLEIEVNQLLGVAESFPVIKSETCHIVRIYYQCTKLPSELRLGSDHDMYEWVSLDNLDTKNYMSEVKEMIEKVL